MENGPFIDGLPITNGDFPWLWMLNNQMVYIIHMFFIPREGRWPRWAQRGGHGLWDGGRGSQRHTLGAGAGVHRGLRREGAAG